MCLLLSSTYAQICPRLWDPVCGVNPLTRSVRTFPNLCELEQQQDCGDFGRYRLLHRGECYNNYNNNENEGESTGLSVYGGGGLNSVCPAIYQPVCGINRRNGHQRTFSNDCVLRNEGWLYEFLHEGECFRGPQACTLQWDPVCATRLSDGSQRTFSNECLLRVEQSNNPGEQYQYSHHGECNEYQEIQPFERSLGESTETEGFNPNQVCSFIWKPVCAIRLCDRNQKTFSNECLLRNQQRTYPGGRYVFLHQGECRQIWNPLPYGHHQIIGEGGSSYEEHDHQDHEESSTTAYGGHHEESSSSSHSESNSSPNIIRTHYSRRY